MYFAIIPAAGQSSRMGRSKLSLPFNGRTMLEHVIDSLIAGGVEQVVVVLGPHVAHLATLAISSGAHVCQLSVPTTQLRETVEHALRWLDDRFHPNPTDGWFLKPADHPAVRPEVVRQLCRQFEQPNSNSILIPTFTGQWGHPALIAWRHVPDILEHPHGEGLNTFFRAHGETREVPVDDYGILVDVDTHADYELLRQQQINATNESPESQYPEHAKRPARFRRC
jgi:molybdenum cofactor cytidylyltransferase